MLRKEQNELLTRTGAGTPMGEMFRRYWMPALLAEELPENDCPPVRVQLLSEKLIAFRDTEGRYGLMDEFCAHRGVSLWFGRNEECGLRCPYHGWKYDVTGQCVDIPSEPEKSGFRAMIKLRSYPLVERGGVLWTYMGPPEHQPGLPEFEFAMVPPEQTYTSKRLQYSNWLQALEGGIDSSHVSWLHRDGAAERSADGGFTRQPVQHGRCDAGVRGGRSAGRPVHRRATQRRGRLLLADHAVVHAVLHHDRAARQSSGARAFLDSDRRRELLGVELRLSSDARADGGRSAGDARRQAASTRAPYRAPIFRLPTATTTT